MAQPFPQTVLGTGETFIWQGKPAYEAFLSSIILSIIWIIIGLNVLGILYIGSWISLLVFFIPAVLTLFRIYFKVNATTYYLTNLRVVHEYSSFFRGSREETTLDQITNVLFNQGLFQKLLNYGNVILHTAGTGFPGIHLEAVKDPVSIRRMIINAKNQYKDRRYVGPNISTNTYFCGFCGSQINQGITYCPNCGKKQ